MKTDNRKNFQSWIDTFSVAENRLYYRDQSDESLRFLTDLVGQYEPTKIIELGTLSGMSLRTWIAASHTAEIIAIDLSLKPLYESDKLIPVDLSRVTLLEQNILETDFTLLWATRDRVILYIDAHDLPNVPIMNYVLDNAVAKLPPGSIVIIDDFWYSHEAPSDENVSDFFKNITVNKVDSLQCFNGHYAPYWKGGFFMGFLEVVPFMYWVNRYKIELGFQAEGKAIMFECKDIISSVPDSQFEPKDYKARTGNRSYNPMNHISVHENVDLAIAQQAKELACHAVALFAAGRSQETLDCFDRMLALTENITGVFYAKAVCFAKLGRFDFALSALSLELDSKYPHDNAKNLQDDINKGFRNKNT